MDGKAPPPTPNEVIGLASHSGLPLYDFENTPESILKSGGELVYAYSSWIVKMRPPDTTTPIIASFYWDETNAVWLPWELLSGNIFRGTDLVPIF
jgi:hypothetical protein